MNSSIGLVIWFLIGASNPQHCGPEQTWQWIPEAQIHACTVPYPAKVAAP